MLHVLYCKILCLQFHETDQVLSLFLGLITSGTWPSLNLYEPKRHQLIPMYIQTGIHKLYLKTFQRRLCNYDSLRLNVSSSNVVTLHKHSFAKTRSTHVFEYTMCSYLHRESNEHVMLNTLFLGYIAITR